MKWRELSRRRMLKAGGATLALPALFAPERGMAQTKPAKRLLLFFVAEGCERTTWWPTAPRQLVTPAASVQYVGRDVAALDPWKSRLNVIHGLDHTASKQESGCYHNFGMRYALTGGYGAMGKGQTIEHLGQLSKPGISIDRFLAKYIRGEDTPLATYELGVVSGGRADPWKIATSYEDRTKPRYPQDDPVRVFSDLFGEGGPVVRRKSVLDFLKTEISQIRCVAGKDATAKLDAHLESVRAIETQLDKLRALQAGVTKPTINPALSAQYRTHLSMPQLLDAQMNLAVTMLASGMSRIVSINNMHTVSRQIYDWLVPRGYVPIGDHHDRVSHNTAADAVKDRTVIYTWFAEQFAELLRRLEAIKEPDGSSLLDNTLVVYYSEMSFGNEHNPNDIPTILAGGLQGAIKTGQYVDYAVQGQHRSFNDLWVTVANAFDVPIKSFGDQGFTRGPLAEILA